MCGIVGWFDLFNLGLPIELLKVHMEHGCQRGACFQITDAGFLDTLNGSHVDTRHVRQVFLCPATLQPQFLDHIP